MYLSSNLIWLQIKLGCFRSSLFGVGAGEYVTLMEHLSSMDETLNSISNTVKIMINYPRLILYRRKQSKHVRLLISKTDISHWGAFH